MKTVLATITVLAAGCTPPGVQYASTNPSPGAPSPRPAQSVQIYFTPPACSYVEIGYVETTAPMLRRDWTIARKLEAMREAAGEQGADAILVIDHNDSGHNDHDAQVISHNFAAVAVTFTDEACANACVSQCEVVSR